MRLIVNFDLPTTDKACRKDYRKFRTLLIERGYIMNQFSYYSLLCADMKRAIREKEFLSGNKPSSGNIQVLIISEQEFANISYILGEKQEHVIDSSDTIIYV
jgi:CRISPR-associated protein Cas2